MARPLRIEYAGVYYHVMDRGDRRQTVFAGPKDYELGRLDATSGGPLNWRPCWVTSADPFLPSPSSQGARRIASHRQGQLYR